MTLKGLLDFIIEERKDPTVCYFSLKDEKIVVTKRVGIASSEEILDDISNLEELVEQIKAKLKELSIDYVDGIHGFDDNWGGGHVGKYEHVAILEKKVLLHFNY